MKTVNKNKPAVLSKATPSNAWKTRKDFAKLNRGWLKKSADIALRVLDLLDEKGISQAELAARLNVSRQQVSKIVKGQENLTLETIARLEYVLDAVIVAVPQH